MRGLLLALFVVGSLPWMVYRPFVGLLFWMWLGFMNPHRLTWGWTYHFPFVQLVAISTIVGWFVSKEPKRMPGGALPALWVTFIVWTTITTLLAVYPDRAWPQWAIFMKIQVMVLFILLLLNNRQRINVAVLTIVASICFYGVKGGIFTIIGGGQHMVLGPRGSFISGNTEIAFAIVVTLPFLWYLRSEATERWQRLVAVACFALCLVAVLGSYSRGAVLALSAMLAFLWLRSKGKLLTGTLALMVLATALMMMPEQWRERMGTVEHYQQDESARSRINSWSFALNFANDHPIAGGGFEIFTEEQFAVYAPMPERVFDAHSIFFQVLAEHGYVGLLLFLALGTGTFIKAFLVQRRARGDPQLSWAASLAGMCQVSLIGYVVGGAFLGLAYFDLLYAIFAIVVVTGDWVARAQAASVSRPADAGDPSAAGLGRLPSREVVS